MKNQNATPKPKTPAELSCTDLLADVDFLVARSGHAGSCSFSDGRETGMSSNSIVAIAYGKLPLENQVLPSDWSDLNACERMWLKLPKHRKTLDAITALARASREVNAKYPKSANVPN